MNAPLLLLLVLLPASVRADAVIHLRAEQSRAAAVVTAPLASLHSDGERRLPAQAIVPPAQIEIVTAPLGGTVTGIKAAYGDRVRRGQVLARLQGPQLLELQREFATARAQAEVAAEARRRDEALFGDGIVSRARLATTQAVDRQAAALEAEKRAALRLAGMAEPAADGRSLNHAADIRAPYDGVVLEASVQPGQRVDAATPLFKLGRLAPLWLEIQATPAQAAGLAPGDPVRVAGCAGGGKLVLIAPQLNAATQSQLLRAEIANGDGCVKPFAFVQAQVVPARPAQRDAWRVPVGALARHQGRDWCFVERPDGYLPVALKLLDESADSALVAAEGDATALSADARIVVKGVAAIKAAWLGIGAGD